jgi:predicted hydrolase (HD superfamily)
MALETGLTREQAHDLLCEYNKDAFHVEHGETVERLMRYFAQEYDPENVEFWGQVGLLHDLDWEMFDPDLHTVETARLLAEAGASPELAKSIQTHNADLNPDLPKPELKMEKMLYACDELSGLIGACVAMRPSKSVMDFNVKSLKKKFKTKNFAAGCNRDDIRAAAELNGLELDELFALMIGAMQATAPDRDTFGKE